MIPRSLVQGPLRTIASPATRYIASSTRAFTTYPVLKTDEAPATSSATDGAEQQQQAPRRAFGGKKRFDSNNNNSNNRNFKGKNNDRRARRYSGNNDRSVPKFERPAPVPYNTQQPLYFAEPEDWVVSSVTGPRPLYANVATGDADASASKVGGALIETATVTGLRAHGDLDPWVEQSVLRELSEVAATSGKDHQKKSDTSVEFQEFYIQGLSSNFQEILNPKNKINRFNNGGLANQARYEASSEETTTTSPSSSSSSSATTETATATTATAAKDETLVERSWKRLEYHGGDYSRPAHPLKHLASQPPQGIKPAGSKGKEVLEHVSALVGQNQSVGFEDKKKMLRAVQKGLSGF
ncbi:hypothetical protein DFQ26_006684 [Actinomortierella ambigua]|nr:hypothetical protein DFQ26_006684 [Actinomortierella ambigua]